MSFYTLDSGYSLSNWYENVNAYDLNAGTDSLLDAARHVLNSDAYMYQGVVWPKGDDILIPPGETFSGSINLQPNSYLLCLTGWSTVFNHFTLRIYDKGAQTDLYYGQFAWYPTVISNMSGTANMGQIIVAQSEDKPFGPYFFQSPLIVMPPGVLQIQVTNTSKPTPPPDPISPNFEFNFLQMLFGFAVPKTTTTLDNRRVEYGNDPSGLNTLQGLASGITNLLG
jgi:hypothetical protein